MISFLLYNYKDIFGGWKKACASEHAHLNWNWLCCHYFW